MVEEKSFLFGDVEEPGDGYDEPEVDDGFDDPTDDDRGTSRRQWIILAAGFVAFLVVVVGAVVLVRAAFEPSEGEPVGWRDPVVDGSSVTVSWDAQPCAAPGDHTVRETDDEVVITVREVPKPTLCSSPGRVEQATFDLDDPLGDRELLDGSR